MNVKGREVQDEGKEEKRIMRIEKERGKKKVKVGSVQGKKEREEKRE